MSQTLHGMPSGGASATALAAVHAAIPGWVNSLLDLSGRNDLLFCKMRGKVPLEQAKPDALSKLMRGDPVRLTALFPVAADLEQHAKPLGRMRKNIRMHDEERGVRVGRLVSGFVSWSDRETGKSRVPNAPLLLRYVSVQQPQPGIDDFIIQAEPDVEVNRVLLHLLAHDFGVRLAEDLVEEMTASAATDFYPAKAASALLTDAAARVPGIGVQPGILLGNFTYQKLPMVQDLEAHQDEFAASDLVAAVAGCGEAMGAIRTEVGSVSRKDPDFTPPASEFLVLDADPSQNYAINAALAGRNIVIQGPPGTGKSQTIANLIAASIANGKTVLFVAEKRAAIDAVLGRLGKVGLSDLVLDLHDGASNKSRVCAEIGQAIAQSRRVADPNVDEAHHKLVRERSTLMEHDEAMHKKREPWGVSVYEAQAMSFEAVPEARLDLRLVSGLSRRSGHYSPQPPGRWTPTHLRTPTTSSATPEARPTDPSVLERLTKPQVRDVCSLLEEAALLGVFRDPTRRSLWATATTLSEADTAQALGLAREAAALYSTAQRHYQATIAATRVLDPGTLRHWGDAIALLEAIEDVQQLWRDELWVSDPENLMRALASRQERRAQGWDFTWGARRAAKREVRGLATDHTTKRDVLQQRLQDAVTALHGYRKATANNHAVPPRHPTQALATAHTELVEAVNHLQLLLHRSDLLDQPLDSLHRLLSGLSADPSDVIRTARANAILRQLDDQGLSPFIEALRHKSTYWTDDEASTNATYAFMHVWATSILEHIQLTDMAIGGFTGSQHTATVRNFMTADEEHLRTTPRRILRRHAERLSEARNQHAAQERHLEVELKRRTRIKPVRELINLAPDVIFAAKPCWAMSPLVVSQVLPANTRFDIVIFDEASQVRPADAIPSLGRAKQAVICGDSKQLPPTSFFDKGDSDNQSESDTLTPETDDNMRPLTEDIESILDVFEAALGNSLASEYRLLWHYRSRDARLIAFSDAWFYNKSLTALPGTRIDPPVSLHVVEHPEGQPQRVEREVEAVVELALKHAAEHPQQSLGVMSMNLNHARRIEDALDRKLHDIQDDNIRAFFRDADEEPFFVKNLERVQGDERDVIIISLGIVKEPDGRVLNRLGPINNGDTGPRRLNVAFSRAKDQLVLVSSFTHDDLDPNRFTSDGAQLLTNYIRYVASGGSDLGEQRNQDRPLNPFEIHVFKRLRHAGIPVIPQYGVAGYWIDFAAQHPTQPGRMVLAIEADGASYHSSETARARDRLRQQHLESLGWTFHRIWSTDYRRDPDKEIAAVRAAYDAAVIQCDTGVDQSPKQDDTPTPGTTEEPAPTRGSIIVTRGLSIREYTDRHLDTVIKWVMSDGYVRTDNEILDEAMQYLQFRRRGSVIVDRLTHAIRRYRGTERQWESPDNSRERLF